MNHRDNNNNNNNDNNINNEVDRRQPMELRRLQTILPESRPKVFLLYAPSDYGHVEYFERYGSGGPLHGYPEAHTCNQQGRLEAHC